jgi:hypothetical protein
MLRKLLVSPLVFATVLSSSALAQQRHVVDPAALAGAVTQRAADQEAQRAAVREALERPQVRDLASKAGVNPDRLTASVASLSGDSLQQAADMASQVNETLAGGASVIVISTTTIIIVLLLILLLVAIAD